MQITIIAIDTGATFAGAVIQDGTGAAALGKTLARTKRALKGMYGDIFAAAQPLDVSLLRR